MGKKLALILALSTFSAFAVLAKSNVQYLDFTKITGPIKPVHSVGQPPLKGMNNASMFHWLTEAGVKYSRLHDIGGEFGDMVFVDIPNIFRDFNADENEPASYDFTFTDLLLSEIVKAGMEPYYRLGVSIENYSTIKAYRIYPPEDFEKWARICEHIILHYNYGWADGFRHGITHWEIWNEADGYIDPLENQMWRGTFDQYMELYGVAATYLKGKFPELMIGGPACTSIRFLTGDYTPDQKERREYTLNCFIKFIQTARDQNWPLDFCSFHSYSAVHLLRPQIDYVRKTLDENGFTQTQMSLNEWLPSPTRDRLGTAKQAAEIASALTVFQDSSLDDAELYDARMSPSNYSPLFDPMSQTPRKAYYSLRMFGELKALGSQVAMPQLPEDVYGCAATDGNDKAIVMIANISGKDWKNTLQWPGYKIDSVSLIDESHSMDEVKNSRSKKLATNSVMLIRLSKMK